MSDSKQLRERLEAAQAQLAQVEHGGADEAMVRVAMQLNERQQQLTAAKTRRAKAEAELVEGLKSYRSEQDQAFRAIERSGGHSIERTFEAFLSMLMTGGVYGLWSSLADSSLDATTASVIVAVVGALGAGVSGFASRRARSALDEAARLL